MSIKKTYMQIDTKVADFYVINEWRYLYDKSR